MEDKKKIAALIRDFLARERMSREQFAFKTKLGKSTVDKLLIGLFSDKTAAVVERYTGLSLRDEPSLEERASPDLGAYVKSDYTHYIGDYVLVRPAFAGDYLCAFAMKMAWDPSKPGLMISGEAEGGFRKIGHIAIPKNSSYLFISSGEKGWLSTTILSCIDHDECLYGLLLTMGNVFGNNYVPMCLPTFLKKITAMEPSMVGIIKPAAPRYADYAAALRRVLEGEYGHMTTLGVAMK